MSTVRSSNHHHCCISIETTSRLQTTRFGPQMLREAHQEFLMQYRRAPLSKLLNGRQIRTKIDTLLPSPAHLTQGKQTRENQSIKKPPPLQHGGPTCYALHCGPRQDRQSKWKAVVVAIKVPGSRSVNVRAVPNRPKAIFFLKPHVYNRNLIAIKKEGTIVNICRQ